MDESQMPKIQHTVADVEQEASCQSKNSEHEEFITECHKSSITKDVRNELPTKSGLPSKDISSDSKYIKPVSGNEVKEFSKGDEPKCQQTRIRKLLVKEDAVEQSSNSPLKPVQPAEHCSGKGHSEDAVFSTVNELQDNCKDAEPGTGDFQQLPTGISSVCSKNLVDVSGACGDGEFKYKDDSLTKTNMEKLSEQVNEEPAAAVEHLYNKDGDGEDKGATKKVEEVPEENPLNDEDADDMLMGYHFTEDGVLVDRNGRKFQFKRYDTHAENQRRYERLGEKINEYVYNLLETRCKLKKVYIPLDAKEEEAQSFIFVSEGAFDSNADKLVVFIHGSGVVRAGQWARSLIINHNLKYGTQIPFIEKAREKGYEVMVLNTNLNSLSNRRWPEDDELIRGSEDPERHAVYVWDNLIEKKVKAKHIAIIAHSYGGVVTKQLVGQKKEDFLRRVFAIAFTDSVHYMNLFNDPKEVIEVFRDRARNWVTSSLPLDEHINGNELTDFNDAPRFSAGHTQHEWTSWSSFEAVFKYLDEQYLLRI